MFQDHSPELLFEHFHLNKELFTAFDSVLDKSLNDMNSCPVTPVNDDISFTLEGGKLLCIVVLNVTLSNGRAE